MARVDDVPPPSSSATVPLGLGELIAGKYRVERLIGAGGMGLVVLATHTELERRVAIKMMRQESLKDPDARARFAREAKAAVRLKSEHVARVIDVGVLDDGAPFLVMEYLEGQDLATLIEERGDAGLPIDQAVAYLLQVCEAVAEAHSLGIVHRDLKPRNVFVTRGVDGAPLLKVLDFGISKVIASPEGTADLALTRTTDVIGSPSYMAPEQLRAARDVDARADIWSLGVMLYECITSLLPWEAESLTELGAMVLRDAPRTMRAVREGVPSELEEIVLKCLEKNRDDRFDSVEELARALEPFALGRAVGSADRISNVARTSRRPPPAPGPGVRRSSPPGRLSGAGGTSVSWADSRAQAPGPSIPVPPRERSWGAVGVAVIGAMLLAGGGYALARRTAPPAASGAAVLPEDRAAIRPPPSVAVAPSVASAAVGDPPADAGPALATGAIGSVLPRTRTSSAPASAPSSRASASATAEAPAHTSAPPDAHNMGSIPRK